MTFLPEADAKPVILVIDDHADLLVMIRRILESRGYGVITASNGVEGLHTLMTRKGDVAAVIVDLYMPKLGGAHFVELIRIAWPSLPILVISAYADAARAVIERLDLTVLPKPFTMPALLNVLSTMLD